MENPIVKFGRWWTTALHDSPLQQKSAVCVSTLDQHGYPSGRFVDLKAVDQEGFTFCTALDSDKGHQIAANPKVALTIWWDHVGYQVRVKGIAAPISEDEAQVYWAARKRKAQLTTRSAKQSRPLESEEALRNRLAEEEARYRGIDVPKPVNWGGFRVRPESIEFLTFKETRLHKRELFSKNDVGAWWVRLLQP